MNQDVAEAIEELKRAYPSSTVTVSDDGNGGAHVIVETVDLGPRFQPSQSWMGGHIPALYPNADIYPVFIAAAVSRVNGKPFEAPVTPNATFMGRAAWQVSRANHQIHMAPQTAVAKFTKIRHFLESLP